MEAIVTTNKRMVIALGGNAITLPGEQGTIPEQFAHTSETMSVIAEVIASGYQVIMTHGNGPQVGNILRRSEIAAAENIYPIPLELCIADTQGAMGYMICQCLENQLIERRKPKRCTTIITTVLVDEDGPEFSNPTKPIGMFYAEDEARLHIERDRWQMVYVPSRGWRRVVPSPPPKQIVEIDMIRESVGHGELVVCCGGGGIPVKLTPNGSYRGVDAVIDKDRTAALLAAELNADILVILTGVAQVCTGFGTPQEKSLSELTPDEALALLNGGEFPAGSMGPKIEAAVDFLRLSSQASSRVLITDHWSLPNALEGRGGTWITRGSQG